MTSLSAAGQAALYYAWQGLPVFPCYEIREGHCTCSQGPACGSPGKHPRTQHGHLDATTDAQQITDWWTRSPQANVAMRTGGRFAALDVDKRSGGFQTLELLEAKHGVLPATLRVKTGGGGEHHHFVIPDGEAKLRSVTLGPGVELKAEGGAVLLPPSATASPYEWVNNLPRAPLPGWVSQLAKAPPTPVAPTNGEKIAIGERHRALASMAGTLRAKGADYETILAALRAYSLSQFAEPSPDAEIERMAKDYAQKPTGTTVRQSQTEALPSIAKDAAQLSAGQWGDAASNVPAMGASAATMLVKLVRENAALFHNGDTCYATIAVGNHEETHALRSRSFRSWLGKLFFDEKERAATGEALTSATVALEGYARFQGEKRAVFVRLAENNEKIYLDLCNSARLSVEITPAGWNVIPSTICPVKFRRAHGMLELPMPERGGSITELRHFLNVGSDDDFILLIAWLMGALHPHGPYPMLILHGEQGSAKTTMAKVLRDLLDPNLSAVRSEPREPRDLMIAANNGWLCSFDNLSSLPAWLSDAFCRLSTGGGFGTRALYTDDEEIIFEARRPVMVNGIEELATRGDLLDRSIILDLPRITKEKCQPEKELLARYEKARPRLLGALLDALSVALAKVDSVHLDELPRMADFSLWVIAAELSLGFDSGSFLRAYSQNRAAANELPLETPIVEALKKLSLPWNGTATELLKALEQFIDDRVRHSKSWPGSGRSCANALRRLAPNLRQTGLAVEFSREARTGRRTLAVSEKVGNSSSPSSPSSPNTVSCFGGDDGDDGKHPFSGADMREERL